MSISPTHSPILTHEIININNINHIRKQIKDLSYLLNEPKIKSNYVLELETKYKVSKYAWEELKLIYNSKKNELEQLNSVIESQNDEMNKKNDEIFLLKEDLNRIKYICYSTKNQMTHLENELHNLKNANNFLKDGNNILQNDVNKLKRKRQDELNQNDNKIRKLNESQRKEQEIFKDKIKKTSQTHNNEISQYKKDYEQAKFALLKSEQDNVSLRKELAGKTIDLKGLEDKNIDLQQQFTLIQQQYEQSQVLLKQAIDERGDLEERFKEQAQVSRQSQSTIEELQAKLTSTIVEKNNTIHISNGIYQSRQNVIQEARSVITGSNTSRGKLDKSIKSVIFTLQTALNNHNQDSEQIQLKLNQTINTASMQYGRNPLYENQTN